MAQTSVLCSAHGAAALSERQPSSFTVLFERYKYSPMEPISPCNDRGAETLLIMSEVVAVSMNPNGM